MRFWRGKNRSGFHTESTEEGHRVRGEIAVGANALKGERGCPLASPGEAALKRGRLFEVGKQPYN